MIAARSFAHQTVGVFGGIASVRALIAGRASVFAWDDDEAARAATKTEGATVAPFGEWPWARLKALVLSLGPSEPQDVMRAAREAGVEIIGELELFAREIKPGMKGSPPVVAIAGSKGKSTTAALIGHILSSSGFAAEIGGGIGKPALELAAPSGRTIYALEVPAGQIDLSPSLAPNVTVLTNIATDRPETGAATRLLERTTGQVCIGVDDPQAASIYTRLSAAGVEAVPVSIGKVLGRGVFAVDGALYDAQGQRATKIMDLSAAAQLSGPQNWQSAALAYAATKKLVRDPRAIARTIANFPGIAQSVGRALPERQAS